MKTRDEDIVDYVSGGERIAREMRYVSETTEGERIGDWPPPPSTMRTHRLHKQGQKKIGNIYCSALLAIEKKLFEKLFETL